MLYLIHWFQCLVLQQCHQRKNVKPSHNNIETFSHFWEMNEDLHVQVAWDPMLFWNTEFKQYWNFYGIYK